MSHVGAEKNLQRDFHKAWEGAYCRDTRAEVGGCRQCDHDGCVLCGAACGWAVLERAGVRAGHRPEIYQEYLDEYVRDVAGELKQRRAACERTSGKRLNRQTRRLVTEEKLRKLLSKAVVVPVATTNCTLPFTDEGKALVKAVSQADPQKPNGEKKADIRIPSRDADKGKRVFIECKSPTFNDLGAALVESGLTSRNSDTRFGLLLWEPMPGLYDQVREWNDRWRKRRGFGAFDYVLASDPSCDPGFTHLFEAAESIREFLTGGREETCDAEPAKA